MERLPSPSPSCLSAASRCAASCGDTSTETEVTHTTSRKRLSQPGEHPRTLPSSGAGSRLAPHPANKGPAELPWPSAAHTSRAALVCSHSSERQVIKEDTQTPTETLSTKREQIRPQRVSRLPKESVNAVSLHHCLRVLRVPQQALCPEVGCP